MRPINSFTQGSRAILSGFVSVIIIITTLAVGSAIYINHLIQSMEQVVAERNVRIDHMSNILVIAHERALLTQTMLIVRDPFEFDETSIRVSALLQEFLDHRNAILALELDARERHLMNLFREHSDLAGNALRLSSSLALEERYEEAAQVFYEEGRVEQLKAIDVIQAFIEHQHQVNKRILQHTQAQLSDAYILSLLIGLMGIVVSITIGTNVHKRTIDEINARTRVTLMLHHSEERERVIRENMADVVVTIGADGRVTSVNQAITQLFRWSVSELVGTPFEQFFNAVAEPTFPWSNSVNPEDGDTVGSEREWLVRRKNGEMFPVSMIITEFHVGYEREYVAVIRDISKKKEAENRLRQANRDLESFSYSISHDLHAPLRSIAGYTHLLEEDYDAVLDDTGRDYIGRVTKAAVRMGEMIDALLNLATLSRTEPQLIPVNLSAIVQQHFQMLTANNPNRIVTASIEPDLIATGDAGLLRVLLQNLLENAWKFTKGCADGSIAFGRRNIREEDVYYVQDNGVGFDTAEAGTIFEPFHRLHGNEFEGHGIGLTTVRRIVQQHGGRVWIDGAPQQGACVYFTLRPKWDALRESDFNPDQEPVSQGDSA